MKHYFLLLACLISTLAFATTYEAPFIDTGARDKCVEVYVDGIKRLFTFDTGCTSLSINIELLNELVKQQKVNLADVNDEREAQLANGYTHVVRRLMLRELTLGGYTFHNVVAHVGLDAAPDAPLLLGQSLLERMQWYKIAGNTILFEPYDEAFQYALSFADYYSSDTTHQQEIARRLLPYEQQGMLSCYFRLRLFYALYFIDDYNTAIRLGQTLKQVNCQAGIDITDYMIQLYYNQAIDLYNANRYDEALARTRQAWTLANSDTRYIEYIASIGKLTWHIYRQLGNDEKMKEFEKFK